MWVDEKRGPWVTGTELNSARRRAWERRAGQVLLGAKARGVDPGDEVMAWIELHQSDWIEALADKPETRGAVVPDDVIDAFLEGDAIGDVASRMGSVPIEWRLDICILELSFIVE